jgi:hypothetical protein
MVTVSLRNPLNGNVTISVYDLSGRLAASSITAKAGELLKTDLDISALERGYYMIEVRMNGKQYRQKLVKQ